MAPTFSTLDHEILTRLVNGEAVALSSHLRLRLEMAGLIRDGAKGIVVTEAGKHLARQRLAVVATDSPGSEAKVSRDARGRRMPLRRKPFF